MPHVEIPHSCHGTGHRQSPDTPKIPRPINYLQTLCITLHMEGSPSTASHRYTETSPNLKNSQNLATFFISDIADKEHLAA